MVVKRQKQNPSSKQAEKKGRVKVGKLKLNKETVKDLGGKESKQVKGGQRPRYETAGCQSVDVCGTAWSPCCD